MRFWLAAAAPALHDWPLRCIMPLLDAATRDSKKDFMASYTADEASSIRIMNRLLAGIRDPELPNEILVMYFCVLSCTVTQILDSPALRDVVTGLLGKIVMVTYSSLSRKLCEEFDENILPLVGSGVEAIL